MKTFSMTGTLPYGSWLVRAGLCDLVDEKGGAIESDRSDERTRFVLSVYGNVSRFAIDLRDVPAARATDPDRCELTIEMTEPAEGLSREGRRRAMYYVLDSISQRIENELKLADQGGRSDEAM